MLIAVANQSTRMTNADVAVATRAVASQMKYHIAPAWGRIPVPVIFYSDITQVPTGADLLVVLDNADQAGALGFHDETPQGDVYAKVFVAPTLDNGGTTLQGNLSVASVISHEVAELFCDAACHTWCDNGQGKLYALEVADAVESGSYDVPVKGAGRVSVSNFVFPEWFDPQAQSGDRFDYLKVLTAPFTMSPGGYVIVADESGVTQQFGDEYPEWKKATKQFPAARTFRRLEQNIPKAA